MLRADLLCGPQWPCTWAQFKASALPTKMEHSFSCKRTEKKTEEENWPTNVGESPALTTHPTILSKPSAVWFFPQIYTSSDILTTSPKAPSLGNYCTKHLEMTASTTYLHLVIRETTVRLNEDNEDIQPFNLEAVSSFQLSSLQQHS